MGFSLGNLNPVKAIDNALVQLDKGVKNVGGWEVVGPAAAAAIAAPYVLPELMGSGAGAGFGLNPAVTSGTFGTLTAPTAGYTFGEIAAPSLASMQASAGLGGTAAAGLTAAQKAMLVRGGMSALSQMAGGQQSSNLYSGGGSGSSGGYNYASLPYLANPQQNQTYMKLGPEVSGSGTTTAGTPVQLDTTRHNILMANLLRG